MYEKCIFVDFDGTICPNKGTDEKYPAPHPECGRALKRMKNQGYTIVLYSVRSNARETKRQNGHDEMIRYMNRWKLPYDAIYWDKPHFSRVIDDKCFGIAVDSNHNVDWDVISKSL